ncbi:hypothetical protein D3C83_107290 [compost metagenome]
MSPGRIGVPLSGRVAPLSSQKRMRLAIFAASFIGALCGEGSSTARHRSRSGTLSAFTAGQISTRPSSLR